MLLLQLNLKVNKHINIDFAVNEYLAVKCRIIRQFFVDNNHLTIIIFAPDQSKCFLMCIHMYVYIFNV